MTTLNKLKEDQETNEDFYKKCRDDSANKIKAYKPTDNLVSTQILNRIFANL